MAAPEWFHKAGRRAIAAGDATPLVPRRVVTVEYVDCDQDLWCFDCNLSTGLRLWVTVTTAEGSSLDCGVVCRECCGDHVEDV